MFVECSPCRRWHGASVARARASYACLPRQGHIDTYEEFVRPLRDLLRAETGRSHEGAAAADFVVEWGGAAVAMAAAETAAAAAATARWQEEQVEMEGELVRLLCATQTATS